VGDLSKPKLVLKKVSTKWSSPGKWSKAGGDQRGKAVRLYPTEESCSREIEEQNKSGRSFENFQCCFMTLREEMECI
jgi:hypothetical protein